MQCQGVHIRTSVYSHHRRPRHCCASAASMALWNCSKGSAPTTDCPLMKKVGVPRTPAACPSEKSFATSAAYFPEPRQELNCWVLKPSSAAHAFKFSTPSCD